MKILVINAGSSSVKFTVFPMADGSPTAGGIVERIGMPNTQFIYRVPGQGEQRHHVTVADTTAAVALIRDLLLRPGHRLLVSDRDLAAIGHRVVHGGEAISESRIVDDQIKAIIRKCFELAPLHNPPNLEGIEACAAYFPDVPQVAVFDTAFHANLPEPAYLYGLPYELYQQCGIRRYGFHGISHQYVCRAAARLLDRPLDQLRLISCHLGNGCSVSAVAGGRSVDTSMGFTPLEGLMMGTRSGDLDPAIVFHLMEHRRMDREAVNRLLNHQSGLLGLAGIGSGDVRDIEQAARRGHAGAERALAVFCYRVKKYIGAYSAVLGGVDALIFTAGIGENSAEVRARVCAGLNGPGAIGIALDAIRNQAPARAPREIQRTGSAVKVLVIPTDEALEIARETRRLVAGR